MTLSKKARTVMAVLGAGALASLLAWGFVAGRREVAAERERERPIKAPRRVSVVSGEVVVTLDVATQAQAGIETGTLTPAREPQEIRAYGTIVEIQALVEQQSAYASARAQMEKARSALEASRQEYQRIQTLFKENQNASAKARDAAEAQFRSDQATFEAAAASLRSLEAAARASWGGVLGEWVSSGGAAFDRVARGLDALIQVSIPSGVIVSPSATAHVLPPGGERMTGRFISRAGRTDPRIQGLVFFYIAPSQGKLLPGLNVSVFVPAGNEVSGVNVPPSGVVWFEGKAWVYVRTGPQVFTRREVATNLPTKDGGYLVTTLPRDARIVTRGAQLLLSEESRAEIQVGEDEKK